MTDYEYLVLTFPHSASGAQVHRELTDCAEYGHWELSRVVRYMGGARRAWLRRKVIRVQRTA
jgi:hypothetical protein